MINVNSLVTRKSHNNDIVFVVIRLDGNVAYLKGLDTRLYADAYLDDLEETVRSDDFTPNLDSLALNRDEYFYLPGKILHIDGDEDYLKKCLDFYSSNGLYAVGKKIEEKSMPNQLSNILNEVKPDILVITGHDAYYEKNGDINNINNYKNSKYFALSVRKAREFESSHEKLVIIAGACQSDYEDLIKSGANFASSPKRVNIHALDPAIIASVIAMTDKNECIDIKELLNKTKYGKYGIGGLVGNGMMYVGYPR